MYIEVAAAGHFKTAPGHILYSRLFCAVTKTSADCFVIWPFCLHNQLCLKDDEHALRGGADKGPQAAFVSLRCSWAL